MENETAYTPCPLDGTQSVFWLKKNGYQLYCCPRCDVRFVFPLPNTVQDIYSKDYFTGAEHGFGYIDYDQDKSAMVGTLEQYLDLIQQRLGRSGSLLDVGAATGFFVEVAARHGWQSEGLELSADAVEIGKAKGRAIRQGILEEEIGEGRYDAITMLDVLEHVPKPMETLAAVKRLLRQEGVLFINVPDVRSLLARFLGKNWQAIIPPEHLTYFSVASLSAALTTAGFKNIRILKLPKTFRICYILATMARLKPFFWLRGLAERSAHSRIGAWKIMLPLYDNVIAIAIKK
jgi:SAM-dependent methyltransferase